jgi:hypothetical protein
VADALFVMGLLLPPGVLVVSFALVAVPEGQDARAARRTDPHAH